ncbi:FixH family protein [Roseateles sp.]|uniref:FixH family protein n=1 Tax=Roseateles sp. TaxID=1971397 RepID=UPI0039ED6A23
MFTRILFASTLTAATFAAVVLLSGCSTPPADLDYSLKHRSADGRFVVEMIPPGQGPAIGQIHSWTVKLAGSDGSPVSGARIAVDGGMPQHGHGLPTKPRVTRELASGSYLIEGMKFSMTGWWNLRLDIDAAGARDKAVFNLAMADDGLKRP